jgi:transcriptional antiterminator
MENVMYRVRKVLNHNAIIVVQPDQQKVYLVLNKGIGFGKKITDWVDVPEEASRYSL